MKRTLTAVAGLVALGMALAEPPRMPIDEDTVVKEVEALLDRTPPASQKDLAKVRELVARGIQAHDAHKYDEALKLYDKALEIVPVYANAYYEKSFTLTEKGDQAGALDAIVRALTLDPTSEMSYIVKANVLDDLGFPEKAKQTYLKLLDVQPASYLGRVNLGISETRMGDFAAAKDQLKKARDIDPKKPSAYFHLARIATREECNYEEEAYLEKFLEVGKSDPRANAVRKRLDELRASIITVDPNEPHLEISLVEKAARTLWRTTTHRERNPDACGYRLTFAEEKEILSTLVIPQWRETKLKDKTAVHPPYDLLLKIEDAGFIDEYIYVTKTSALGDPAKAWLTEHADRKQAFIDWARKEKLLDEDPAAEPVEAPYLPADLIETTNASKVKYSVEEPSREDRDRFLKTERARFQDAIKLRGSDTVDCSKADDVSKLSLSTAGARNTLPLFRCHQPGDEVFDRTIKLVSGLGLVARDLAPAIEGAVIEDGEAVHIKSDPAWLFYTMAKAGWRHEPELRARHGGAASDAASVQEETFAFRVLVQAYRNAREKKDGENPFAALPHIDVLDEVESAGHLRGYVLYEVIHRRYGISLKSLEPADAKAVEDYLMTHVVVQASKQK